MRGHPQIAIDGAAGVGKSTIGERVAARLGFLYVDSGAFYRALATVAVAEGTDVSDGAALVALAERTPLRIVPRTVEDGRQYTVLAGSVDITPSLRTEAVEQRVSRVAHHQQVRIALRAHQRAMAEGQSVVMVGRDIGTVVLPDADLKVYLRTSLAVRAHRRHRDLVAALGEHAPTYDEVYAAIARRDAEDAEQMVPAPDAYVIENDDLEPEQTVQLIVERFEALRRASA